MSIDELKYLWDGSEPGWELAHVDSVEWHLTFDFDVAGPTQAEIINLRKVVPELMHLKLPLVYKELRGVAQYVTLQGFGNMEAHKLEAQARELNLRVKKEDKQTGGYLPVLNGKNALIIEDEELLRSVVEKMIAAGVNIIEIHAD